MTTQSSQEWVQRVINFPDDLNDEMTHTCAELSISKSDFIREALAAAISDIKAGGDPLKYFNAGSQ